MDPSQVNNPLLKDLNADNITENTVLINSSCEDPRMKFLMERLVSHLHDFARQTRLSTREWMAGIQFLTAVGQRCDDVRQVGSGQGPLMYANLESSRSSFCFPMFSDYLFLLMP
jgi:Catechol dioxygenase N terminus